MSDKENTKHGNMVALGPFTGALAPGALTNNATVYSLRFSIGGTDYDQPYIAAPFSGHIVAISHTGDYPSAGTWSIAAKVNSTVVEATRLSVAAASSYGTMNSAQSVSFAAGDAIRIVVTTNEAFSPADLTQSAVFLYVMFDNS